MRYVKLGSTGLDISRLCIGCMSFGVPDRGPHPWSLGETESRPIVRKAIEAGIAKMNFVARPIARSRLRKTNPLYERIVIAHDGAQISVRYDQGKPVVMPADGAAVKWTRDDGEVFDVSAKSGDAQLEQTFKAEDGQRVNEFSLAPDGVLTLKVTLCRKAFCSAVRPVASQRAIASATTESSCAWVRCASTVPAGCTAGVLAGGAVLPGVSPPVADAGSASAAGVSV